MSEGGSDYDENIVEERMSGQEEEEEEDNDVDHMVEEKPEAGDNQNQNEENETTKGAVTINQKIGDRTCATYTFKGEDHTLGNLLRYALIKNPDVEFCGYSITHPSENEMNLRLQTTGKGTNRVIKKGFKVINKILEISEKKFTDELKRFQEQASTD